MHIDRINDLIRETAELIRQQTIEQVALWQEVEVPFWSLEVNGADGWSSYIYFSYTYGLHIPDRDWPPKLYVECATGLLVEEMNHEIVAASDTMIVSRYISSSIVIFDAALTLESLREKALHKFKPNQLRNDKQRKELRQQFDVVERHTRPAVAPHMR